MKSRPILYNTSMVRALLAWKKTQTRRIAKTEIVLGHEALFAPRGKNKHAPTFLLSDADELALAHCPYGQPGDQLWVRETFMDLQGTGVEHRPDPYGPLSRYAYRADTPPGSHGDEARKEYGLKWTPSIHMPRAASRITLEITGVRVERLQDISEADAVAEGITYGPTCDEEGRSGGYHWDRICEDEAVWPTAKQAYQALWEEINGPGSWDLNPWVWALDFRRVS